MPRGKYIRTVEHRRNIGAAHIGMRASPETKQKMSVSQTGRKVSEDTKRKIGISNTGKKRTVEAKQKMRAAKLGTHASTETKQKMSHTRLGLKPLEEMTPRERWAAAVMKQKRAENRLQTFADGLVQDYQEKKEEGWDCH